MFQVSDSHVLCLKSMNGPIITLGVILVVHALIAATIVSMSNGYVELYLKIQLFNRIYLLLWTSNKYIKPTQKVKAVCLIVCLRSATQLQAYL